MHYEYPTDENRTQLIQINSMRNSRILIFQYTYIKPESDYHNAFETLKIVFCDVVLGLKRR